MADLILRELLDVVENGGSAVLATIVETDRSVPRHAGTKMLIRADSTISGTIGGGELEARVISDALEALREQAPRMIEYNLVDPSSGDPGICGGRLKLYLEPYMPTATVYVIGCGHIGRAVVELAHWLGYRVVATDDRTELATVEALPDADSVIAGSIVDALEREPVTDQTWVVVVTRNAAVDVEILPHLVKTPARYIGVMGSKRRWGVTIDRLAERGVTEEELAGVISPIGLEMSAETPQEIAMSILGEVTRERRT